MKKLYSLLTIVSIISTATAQDRNETGSVHPYNKPLQVVELAPVNSRAAGDTLMYMKLPKTSINGVDAATFKVVTEDLDGLTNHYPSLIANKSFNVFYSTDSTRYPWPSGSPGMWNFYHPWEHPYGVSGGTDTTYFWAASSYFTSPGKADNWLEFGTLTVPANGGTLKWYDRTSLFRDGYEVLVTNNFSTPGTFDFNDFIDPAIFKVADAAAPSPTLAIDTTWELKTVDLPSVYNGTKVAIAFHHTANDMDYLRLDEIVFTERVVGIEENAFVNGAKLLQNIPNPTNTNCIIKYELENKAAIALNIMDITGKIIEQKNIGEQSAGNHAIQVDTQTLAAGVYYYSLTVGEATSAVRKMMVIK
jgi:hypothetical protein